MARPKKECAKCSFLSDLEMERVDMSYKTFAANGSVTVSSEPATSVDTLTVVEPVVVSMPKPRKANDDRDKLMFNAGRYAAGARDSVAIKANTVVELLLVSE
jgi:hypothetical protein